jgi:hypothetical protein
MEYDMDINSCANTCDYKGVLDEPKQNDSGYNKIWRARQRKDGALKRKKIELYTSGGTGKRIRDAETGEYYTSRVGSLDENLFFKVSLATGECNSKNGSSTLFYISPKQYINHIGFDLDPNHIAKWEARRDERLKQNEISRKPKTVNYLV